MRPVSLCLHHYYNLPVCKGPGCRVDGVREISCMQILPWAATSSTADVEEDGVRVHSPQLAHSPIQHLCTSSVDLEKGIQRHADLQA